MAASQTVRVIALKLQAAPRSKVAKRTNQTLGQINWDQPVACLTRHRTKADPPGPNASP